jgi:putative DNA primase/helicase
VSRVFLLSLVARGLVPGTKVDTCPVFYGRQGIGKSSALRVLVGNACFSDSPLPIGDKDGMQNLRGTWLWEFSENASIGRKERNAVKAFLSSLEDCFRPSYGRHKVTVPRQTCFAATTNDTEFLNDPTGERRYLPVTARQVDLGAIERDREHLLGEAAHRLAEGEQHWPTAEEDRALAPRREQARQIDPWEEKLTPWLSKQKQPFLLTAVLADGMGGGGPLSVSDGQFGPRERTRVAAILQSKGYSARRDKRRGPTRDQKVWEKTTP